MPYMGDLQVAKMRGSKSKIKDADLPEIARLYAAGLPASEIAPRFNVTTKPILRALRRMGIAILSRGDRQRGKPWSESRRSKTPILVRTKSLGALGNKGLSSHGYVRVNTGRLQRKYEHIVIAEKALGRRLKSGEVVHHINTNQSDNRPQNLLICSHGYHLALHARMRRHPLWSSTNN